MMSSFFGEIGFENSAKYGNMEQRLTNPNKALKLSSIEIPWILVSEKIHSSELSSPPSTRKVWEANYLQRHSAMTQTIRRIPQTPLSI